MKSQLERYKLFNIDEIIEYMEKTSEDSWCEKVVRTKGGESNCFFGHLFNMTSDEKEANFNWEMFEEQWATTYMIYPVNDGEHPRYQQATPKQRILAYLRALKSGEETCTWQTWDSHIIPNLK